MSLVGNLEDLGLGDILQIVSLSRKSGVLVLSSRDREGRIVFRGGQVIKATSSVFRENVGDLLVRKGLVTLDVLRKAVLVQRNSERPPRLGTILAEKFGVPAERIEEIVKENVEKIIYSFFAWNEGTFSFELEEPEEVGATAVNPLQFMLDQGLNPQWLAMEGSRILDEKRHRGEDFEEEAEEPLPEIEQLLESPSLRGSADGGEGHLTTDADLALAVAASGMGDSLLLIDDDRQTAEQLSAFLQQRGQTARGFTGGREFLAALEQAVAGGAAPLLVIDMIMPRLDGSGILGGLELAEKVRRRYPTLTTLMMSDHTNAEAEQRARRLGVHEILAKPKRSDLREAKGERALAALADDLAGRLAAGSESTGAGQVHLGAELMRELGEETSGVGPPVSVKTPGLHLLRSMLQELNDPALGNGSILLALRFASEMMNRAVVFFVKGEEIVGLGQFGIAGDEKESADERVRRIRIPLAEESIFRQVLQERVPITVALGEGEHDRELCRQLGGRRPQEIFLGPILIQGEVVAILYGDNLPENRPVGDTEALEIFLSQAGLAMEKALLERRLQGLDGK